MLNDATPVLLTVIVLPETDVDIAVPPLTVNVPPPETEPEPELPAREIVVETDVFAADVARPYASNVMTGIAVEPPYVPAVTAVVTNATVGVVPPVELICPDVPETDVTAVFALAYAEFACMNAPLDCKNALFAYKLAAEAFVVAVFA